MIFLGLVIVLAALVVGTAVVLGNSDGAHLTAFGHEVPGVTEQWHVFMAGAVVAVLFMTGVAIAMLGFKHAVGLRKELRDLREEHEESLHTIEVERRRFQQALAEARRGMSEPTIPVQRMAPN